MSAVKLLIRDFNIEVSKLVQKCWRVCIYISILSHANNVPLKSEEPHKIKAYSSSDSISNGERVKRYNLENTPRFSSV